MTLSTRPPVPEGPYVVAGLGRAGRAATDALVRHAGPSSVCACDDSNGGRLAPVARELGRSGVRTFRGKALRALSTTPAPRTLVKSPGIACDRPIIRAALEQGLVVIDELELGWRLGSAPVVGVTGTNGKSTVSALCAAILRAGGHTATVAGNTDVGPPLSAVGPEPDWVVTEVSSFQLETCPALLPEIAVFTNLAHDHLARHGSMEAYGALKRRLFVRGQKAARAAVICVDDPFGVRLAEDVEARGGRVARIGFSKRADSCVEEARWDLRSAEVVLRTPEGTRRLHTQLPGRYNAVNVLAAVALGDLLGVPAGAASAAVEATPSVPGRFEHLGVDTDRWLLVNATSSPAAVDAFLGAVREGMPAAGRLRVVLGILGRAEPEHCEAMGSAAAELADDLVITSGSFRPQPPVEALEGIAAGAREHNGARVRTVRQRRAAVDLVVREANAGDVVAILGRGRIAELVTDTDGTRREWTDAGVATELARAAAPPSTQF